MEQIKMQDPDKSQVTECSEILKKQAFEFCSETGLHGYKYISQTQRSKIERTIWAIIVISSLCCSVGLIKMSWDFYANHSTLTVIESIHHGIWNYPFPAITICNNNLMSYNLTKEFVNNLKIPSNVSREYLLQEMRLMNQLLLPGVFEHSNDIRKNFTYLQDIINYNNLSILEVMNSITHNCTSLLVVCKWKGSLDRCEKLFKRSLTRSGICCSFNYYVSPNMEDNVEKSASCGFETGMTIIVNPQPNDYYASVIGTYGVKAMIHYSYNYPDFNAETQLVRLNSQHFVSVDPLLMYSTEEVRNLAISTRNCIFDDEADKILYANTKKRNLNFAKYSYHNCLTDCRISTIKIKCDCIPYYYPQNTTRVCNLEDVNCLTKYINLFDTSWPEDDQNIPTLDTLNHESQNQIIKSPCGCIPDCDLYDYPIESSFGTLDHNIYYNNDKFSINFSNNSKNIQNHSIIHVFFNDLVAFQYRRSVNSSWRNLFASFGGLLGLFAGFNLISIFEILYFFVICVIIDVYNLRKANNIQ